MNIGDNVYDMYGAHGIVSRISTTEPDVVEVYYPAINHYRIWRISQLRFSMYIPHNYFDGDHWNSPAPAPKTSKPFAPGDRVVLKSDAKSTIFEITSIPSNDTVFVTPLPYQSIEVSTSMLQHVQRLHNPQVSELFNRLIAWADKRTDADLEKLLQFIYGDV